jgi:hypothetical protein
MTSGSIALRSPLVETYLGCMRNLEWGPLRAWYAPDARIDVTVPEWRFSFRGLDAITGWLNEVAQNFAGGLTVTDAREFDADAFVAVVWEAHGAQHTEAGGTRPVGFRQTDVFVLRNGKVVEHLIQCTGVWDEAVFARIAAEAPKTD